MFRTRLGSNGALCVLACAAALTAWLPRASAQTTYTASWTSLDTHNPAPEWFQDAKFGIYFHWGAFATPMFGSEWYPRNMFNKSGNSSEYQHHMATFGDPYGSWGYENFLKGANDKSGKFVQFAPKLVSDGGNFDPDAWAQMFLDAGAWFAGPVAEHHDGYSMWDSKVNEWNSVAMGPKLNLAKLHTDAIRKKGLKLFMSLHHEWNFGGYWTYGTPTTSDPSLQKLYGKLSNAEEQTLWLNKLKEVIDEFLPDVLYQDRYLSGISATNLMTFLAYYYNAAVAANKDVVAVAKETITDHKGQLYDYERGGPADIRTPYWLTDDSVGSQSWCYVTGLSYYSDAQFIGSFVDRISKGGNMILNVSPMPDGTFPQRQKDIMAAFGKFLQQMGTAIYNTRTFAVYGEGPTKMGGGEFTSPTALTASDIRYTKSKDGDAVYAILGGWPGNGKVVNMAAVTTSRLAVGSGKVYLFAPIGGSAIDLSFTQDTSGLHVTLPSSQPYTALAYAIKISKSGTVPAPTPAVNNGTPSNGGTGGTGGTSSTGGASSAGAASSTGGTGGTGGKAGIGGNGGSKATGGSVSAGGSLALGGATSTGGSRTAGGTSSISSSGGATTLTPTGGRVSIGGNSNQTGGTVSSTGGSAVNVGGNAAGGLVGAGGTPAIGGANALGGLGGTVGAATSQTLTSATNNADPSNSGGCGCRVASGNTRSMSLALLGVLGSLILRSAKRRRIR
jgi:alpha-L-fucosidase